jgi:hypothetical protein
MEVLGEAQPAHQVAGEVASPDFDPVRIGLRDLSDTGPRFHRCKVCNGSTMPTDQYHEPPEELGDEARTFARVIASLQEEAEAIGWYEQRMSIEPNEQARRIMEHAQREEFLHFSMDLEFLARRKEKWRVALRKILFREGDIVELAEQAEDEVED